MSRGEGGRDFRRVEVRKGSERGLADFPFELKSLQERPKRRPRGPKNAKRPARDAKTALRGVKRAPTGASKMDPGGILKRVRKTFGN